MQITLAQIRASVETGALARLAGQKLPIKLSYWIGNRLLPSVQREFDTTEKARVELVQKHGTQDEAGNWSVKTEAFAAFATEFNELLSESVTVNCRAYTLDELPDSFEITPADMRALGWLIIDSSQTEEKPKAMAAAGD